MSNSIDTMFITHREKYVKMKEINDRKEQMVNKSMSFSNDLKNRLRCISNPKWNEWEMKRMGDETNGLNALCVNARSRKTGKRMQMQWPTMRINNPMNWKKWIQSREPCGQTGVLETQQIIHRWIFFVLKCYFFVRRRLSCGSYQRNANAKIT